MEHNLMMTQEDRKSQDKKRDRNQNTKTMIHKNQELKQS